MDVLTPEQRRRNMAAIKGKNTNPELKVRKALHALGFRFRLYRRDLPGRPDIVLPRLQTAIFVHGCFWHMHSCRFGLVRPATNAKFWKDKRAATAERDRRKTKLLEASGWRVLVVWECETRDQESLSELLRAAFAPIFQNSNKVRVFGSRLKNHEL